LARRIEEYDALCIIHQAVDLKRLGAMCAAAGFRRALIVTSHLLFEEERLALRTAAAECAIDATCFSDWLEDRTMETCDAEASAKLARRLKARNVRWFYAANFARESLRAKNAALHRALRTGARWRQTHYAAGLGVLGEYWREQGAQAIESLPEGGAPVPMPGSLVILRNAISFLFSASRFERIESEGRTRLFTSIRRLAIRPATARESFVVTPAAKIKAAVVGGTLVPGRILRSVVGEQTVVATTIHDYPPYLVETPGPVEVFADGFHPSNYPRSYFDQYAGASFVTSDPLSCEWFTRHGGTVRAAPTFIATKPMQPPAGVKAVRAVLLALNHAGDWSALINRSDTDALVAALCAAARLFPDVQFVVRPHPTMTHAAHEGEGSRKRLERHVGLQGLSNLAVSQRSLADDLSGSDIVISEYSQVLIDAYSQGKLGLIANLTRRRSFMADFEQLGFAAVASEAGLVDLLRATIDDPRHACARQALAVQEYNRAFESLMGRGGSSPHVQSNKG
jgi:hypothetical protein